MDVKFLKFFVRRSVTKCNGSFDKILGKPLKKGKIWILAAEHPIVQRMVKSNILRALKDQSKEADG